MPIDHTSLPVSDLKASTSFYAEILRPLGYTVFKNIEPFTVGFHVPRVAGPDFWIVGPAAATRRLNREEGKDSDSEGDAREGTAEEEPEALSKMHLCFKATSWLEVDQWHANAM